jgi:putative FmdB family regulatory protein
VPTYQYLCTECGGQLEAVQKFTDEPLTVHECGGRLRKVFSPVGIVFKGSGFYRNDSRSSSNGSLTGGKDKAESGSKEKSDSSAKSDSSSGDKSDKAAAKSDSSGSSSSKDSSSSSSSGSKSGSTSEKVA